MSTEQESEAIFLDPKVSITQNPIFYNKKWGFTETITLNGKIIDHKIFGSNKEKVDNLLLAQSELLSLYGISDGGLTLGKIVRNNAFLQSVDFAPSDFNNNIDYTIVLICYPNDKFTSAGIIDPVNRWDFSESTERVITLTHTVSAGGINTQGLDQTGFDNARQFVQALVYPTSTAAIPIGFSKCFQAQHDENGDEPSEEDQAEAAIRPNSQFVLISQAENIDRISGTYSVTEVYELDLVNLSKSKINYTVSVDEPVQGFHKASISGEITGGINTTMTELEAIFDAFDFKGKIEALHSITLNSTPITKTKKINDHTQSISFNFEFDDSVSNIDDDKLILSLSLNENKGEDNIKRYNLRGTLKGRSDLTDKFSLIEEAYNSKINVYKSENVFELFSNYYDIENISTGYTAASVTKNKFKGEISFSVSTTDEKSPPEGFQKFDHVVSIEYPFYRAKPYALVGQRFLKGQGGTGDVSEASEGLESEGSDEYVLQKLEYFERARISVNGTAIIKDDVGINDGISRTNTEVLSIASDFLSGDEVMNVKQITSAPNFGKKISFRYSWDYATEPVNSKESLSTIRLAGSNESSEESEEPEESSSEESSSEESSSSEGSSSE